MKPDITRSTFDPSKGYTKVIQQQGRVQLDSDWNEQMDILEHLDRTARIDVIGENGALGDSFKINSDGKSLGLSPGHLYVAGILCEQQKYLPLKGKIMDFEWPDPWPDEVKNIAIYAEVWTRTVDANENCELRDPALKGLDTTARSKVEWRIKYRPFEKGTPWTAPARVGGGELEIDASSPYKGENNYLYLVEIHKGGAIGSATFKWSRHNGSLTYAIAKVTGSVLTLDALGHDAETKLKVGDWVQVTKPGSDPAVTNESSSLLKVKNVKETSGGPTEVTLDKSVGLDLPLLLQRWDQKVGTENGIVIPKGNSVEIERGLRVIFKAANGVFRSGDYWTIPVRAEYGSLWKGPQPPEGVQRHYALLALCRWKTEQRWEVTDRRSVFRSLARPAAAALYAEMEGCVLGAIPGVPLPLGLELSLPGDSLEGDSVCVALHVQGPVVRGGGVILSLYNGPILLQSGELYSSKTDEGLGTGTLTILSKVSLNRFRSLRVTYAGAFENSWLTFSHASLSAIPAYGFTQGGKS